MTTYTPLDLLRIAWEEELCIARDGRIDRKKDSPPANREAIYATMRAYFHAKNGKPLYCEDAAGLVTFAGERE